MDSTPTTELVNFRDALLAHLRGMPDVAAALEAMPDSAIRTRYLRAVLARVAKQADPLLASALALALASTPAESLAPDLAPRAGIVLSRHYNETRRPETIERNGQPFVVPAAVANLLREAMQHDEVDADRRIVAQLRGLLPEIASLLVEQEGRKGDTPKRGIFSVASSLRSVVRIAD